MFLGVCLRKQNQAKQKKTTEDQNKRAMRGLFAAKEIMRKKTHTKHTKTHNHTHTHTGSEQTKQNREKKLQQQQRESKKKQEQQKQQ